MNDKSTYGIQDIRGKLLPSENVVPRSQIRASITQSLAKQKEECSFGRALSVSDPQIQLLEPGERTCAHRYTLKEVWPLFLQSYQSLTASVRTGNRFTSYTFKGHSFLASDHPLCLVRRGKLTGGCGMYERFLHRECVVGGSNKG